MPFRSSLSPRFGRVVVHDARRPTFAPSACKRSDKRRDVPSLAASASQRQSAQTCYLAEFSCRRTSNLAMAGIPGRASQEELRRISEVHRCQHVCVCSSDTSLMQSSLVCQIPPEMSYTAATRYCLQQNRVKLQAGSLCKQPHRNLPTRLKFVSFKGRFSQRDNNQEAHRMPRVALCVPYRMTLANRITVTTDLQQPRSVHKSATINRTH